MILPHIRLTNSKFSCLSLVTDAYSRKIVGYCMHYDLSADRPVNALEMALLPEEQEMNLLSIIQTVDLNIVRMIM